MAPVSKKAKIDALPACPYGKKCYRKNPKHFKEYSHPSDDSDTDSDGSSAPAKRQSSHRGLQIDTTKLPPCPFGAKCYRKNLLHFAEFSHPFTNDGASTSKDIPDDNSGSDTDVIESEEENEATEDTKNGKPPLKSDGSLIKRYSLMSEQERKELVQKALDAKKKLEAELAETKKEVLVKESAIKMLQDEMNAGQLLMDGEAEVLKRDELTYFPLIPEREFKERSAAQVHFRLAESQFYRLLGAGYGKSYSVSKVEYAVNPDLVKKFTAAREELAAERGEEFSHPILAFHGTEEKNIHKIIETGFKIPGVDDKKLEHRMRNEGVYGKGIYFSEYSAYSLGYVAGKNKIMLNKVLPGKIFHTKGSMLGMPLTEGYDSHMSPCGKELVMYHSERILPCYIVHYDNSGREFKYRKPVQERRKAKTNDEMMKLYWKAKKKSRSQKLAGKSFKLNGDFADEIPALYDLIKKHGGNIPPPLPPPAPKRGRGSRARATTFTPIYHYTVLVTTEALFLRYKENGFQGVEDEPMKHAETYPMRCTVVREEFIYDSILQHETMNLCDYEFD